MFSRLVELILSRVIWDWLCYLLWLSGEYCVLISYVRFFCVKENVSYSTQECEIRSDHSLVDIWAVWCNCWQLSGLFHWNFNLRMFWIVFEHFLIAFKLKSGTGVLLYYLVTNLPIVKHLAHSSSEININKPQLNHQLMCLRKSLKYQNSYFLEILSYINRNIN